jgi:type II secretory pathway pseudopilin PulG
VIAVIALLAAVLIPTFVSLTRKANIANDTAVVKNLNTAAISAQAKTFDEALAAAKESGYLVANLNSKADKCYFVWEDDTDQFLLYDLKEKAIIYSNTEVTGDPDDSWCFAVNNPKDQAEVEKVWSNVTFKTLLVNIKDLSAILGAGGTVYMDQSVVLDNKNLLHFDADVTTVINLENSSLNTSGILKETGKNVVPIEVMQGNVNILGGNIITAGEGTNYHNDVISYAVRTRKGSNVTFNGTTFQNDINKGQIKFGGTGLMENVTIYSTNYGVETFYNGQLTLKNTNIEAKGQGIAIWSCNFDHSKFEGDKGHTGTSMITIESGAYNRIESNNSKSALLVACGGDITVNGGTFTAFDDNYFYFGTDSAVANDKATITIKGGTFGETAYENLTIEILKGFCKDSSYNVSGNVTDGFTITKT